jgi:apolipoprotein N-acyltransferase
MLALETIPVPAVADSYKINSGQQRRPVWRRSSPHALLGAQGFGWGCLCGFFYFAGMFYWFVHVTILGTILLCLYLACYFGLFACGYVHLRQYRPVAKILVLASLWVVTEYVRDHLLTGFGWASLGHSQYRLISLIQIASITGVRGVSFLVAAGNLAIVVWMLCIRREKIVSREVRLVGAACVSCLLLIVWWGKSVHLPSVPEGKFKIAVIQPNITQENKWRPSEWPRMMALQKALTDHAAQDDPDLIVWPETSFPGYVWEAPEEYNRLKEFVAAMGIPLLFGAVTKEGDAYYNSAILIDAQGKEVVRHHKLHLVPFGEYLPFRQLIPFIAQFVPIEDFAWGSVLTQFPISRKGEIRILPPFSVLICFEDTVSAVSRALARNGNGLLINITNDGWFLNTKAPLLHLQSAVLQAVQSRRSLVRAANTGGSCFIDAQGRIHSCVQGPDKKRIYVSGTAVATVDLYTAPSFYTKFGDVFTCFCFGCILCGVIASKTKAFKIEIVCTEAV